MFKFISFWFYRLNPKSPSFIWKRGRPTYLSYDRVVNEWVSRVNRNDA